MTKPLNVCSWAYNEWNITEFDLSLVTHEHAVNTSFPLGT